MYSNLSHKLNVTTLGNHSIVPPTPHHASVKIGLKKCTAKLFFCFYCFFKNCFFLFGALQIKLLQRREAADLSFVFV